MRKLILVLALVAVLVACSKEAAPQAPEPVAQQAVEPAVAGMGDLDVVSQEVTGSEFDELDSDLGALEELDI